MQFKKYRIMKKSLYAAILATVIFSSCANEFNRVYKTSDNTYKYEYAKESYTNGKYVRASTLLQGLVTMQRLRGSRCHIQEIFPELSERCIRTEG